MINTVSNLKSRAASNATVFVPLALIMLFAAQTHAVPAEKNKNKDTKALRTVQVTATLTPEDASDVPGAVTVIDRSDMRAAASTAIEQLRGATNHPWPKHGHRARHERF
jgi:outer membrane receptor for ferrienterochelin and colicin